MKYALYPAGFLLAVAALTGCLFGNSSEGTVNPGEVIRTIPYRVEGNALVLGPYYADVPWCSGEILHKESPLIGENVLTLKLEASTFTIFIDTATLESGATLERVSRYSRVGSGTGLEGLWSFTKREQRLVSGILTQEEKDGLENDERLDDRDAAYTHFWLRFTGGKLLTYQKREYAKRFIADWNGEFAQMNDADSARYAITVKAVDQNTVELKGRKNGETVRITHSFEVTTYSSDTPGHALHRFFSKPETCPNEEIPLWYREFLDANAKLIFPKAGLEKRAELHPKSVNPRLFPFGPLKTPDSLLN
jgi:hypothetical protein